MKVTPERLRRVPKAGPDGNACRRCTQGIWRAAVGFLAITSPLFGQPVVYVDGDATGENDGSTWEDAYTVLQDALDHAATSGGSVNEIWVAAGTYRPTKLTDPAEPRSATFQLVDGVGLYGGFAGTEGDRDERDPALHETVLSGDIDDDDETSANESDCCQPFSGSRCGVTECEAAVCADFPGCCDEDWTWVLECAVVAWDRCPSLCTADSDNVRHVLSAHAANGGIVVDGFTITGGHAYGPAFTLSSWGGSMLLTEGSQIELRQCRFVENGGFYGAAVAILDSDATVAECLFEHNRSRFEGASLAIESGRLEVSRCTFLENRAEGGAGIYANNPGGRSGSDVLVDHSQFVGNYARFSSAILADRANLSVSNSIFSGNELFYWDGTVSTKGAWMEMTNCTLTQNKETVALHDAGASLTNCIVAGNLVDPVLLYGDSEVSVSYSVVGSELEYLSGPGNILDDPLFVDADGEDDIPGTTDDDLRLASDSPGIDSGDPDFVVEVGETDLDGHSRVLCGRVDMGAYELGIGDFDCDHVVDLHDFAGWESCMTGPNTEAPGGACEAFDFDADGDVDLKDVAAFGLAFTAP